MAGFLSMVKSIALPVAKIAAQLLPEILLAIPAAAGRAGAAAGGVVKTGMVDWVPDAQKKKIYAAEEGDLFTVANFGNAILDLPFASTANDADRSFVANSGQIPPLGTLVTMFLHPRRPAEPPPR